MINCKPSVHKLLIVLLSLFVFSCQQSDVIPVYKGGDQLEASDFKTYTSPCTDSLSDNLIETSTSAWPKIKPSQITVNESRTKIVSRADKGDFDIKFGSEIEEGQYSIVRTSSPYPDQAQISMTLTFCNFCPYLSQSGTLYVKDTMGKYQIEFCNVEFNGQNNTSLKSSGRILIDQ